VRKIASDMLGLVDNGKRYSGRGAGHAEWCEHVESFKLSEFTGARIAAWKKSFLAKAGSDPKGQRNARVSVNFYLRSAKSLFSLRVRENLGLSLPEPLPFSEVQIERPSTKYLASFDLEELIQCAREELFCADQEAFKVFLLSAMAGLRRKEIDLLPWSAFRWEAGVIRVEHTKHFTPKTADSAGDVAVDPELLTLFRGYYAQDPRAEFVIESPGTPRSGVLYNHYRCDKVFGRLVDWLRAHGVGSAKPIHELRKAFGSVICERAGIHQASRSLRHSDIRVTSAVYIDSRSRVASGLGHLLTPPANIYTD
jgi:integrase